MIGIKTKRPSDEVVEHCIKNGLLVLKAKDKIRLLPPLNIPFDTLKNGVEILCECF